MRRIAGSLSAIGNGFRLRPVILALILVAMAVSGSGCAQGTETAGAGAIALQKIDKGDEMYLETLVVGDIDANCYIVAAESSGETIVIDPGGNAQMILDTIAAQDLTVKYIVLTHAHWDHFAAAAELAKNTGARIGIHKLDRNAITDPKLSLAYMFGDTLDVDPATIMELNDGQRIEFGDHEAEVLHTPGHSPGSITIRIDDHLFTGDLLFQRSIGRTDFPGGSYEGLLKSVRERIFTYPDQVKVYPGHGPSTSVGVEKRENPYFD